MALRSMTGFGRVSGLISGVDFVVEVRSVNHRGLDVKVGLPSILLPLEARLIGLVRSHVRRGRVDMRIRFEHSDTALRAMPAFSSRAVSELVDRLEQVRTLAGITAPITVSDLLVFKDSLLEDPRQRLGIEIWPELRELAIKALAANIEERTREGVVLLDDMLARLIAIEGFIEAIATKWGSIRDDGLERLRKRVQEAVEKYDLGEMPQERMLQEVILVSDRSDISEELTRARGHVGHLKTLIADHEPESAGAIGKKIDFYFQELMRESNTTGSKSHSEVIAEYVVEIRTEIERLREQVLNVE